LEKATTDGVVRDPSEFGMTTGSPASRTDTTELVVPRSIPTALAMMTSPVRVLLCSSVGGEFVVEFCEAMGRFTPAVAANPIGADEGCVVAYQDGRVTIATS
jgi:hypothetical protein